MHKYYFSRDDIILTIFGIVVFLAGWAAVHYGGNKHCRQLTALRDTAQEYCSASQNADVSDRGLCAAAQKYEDQLMEDCSE